MESHSQRHNKSLFSLVKNNSGKFLSIAQKNYFRSMGNPVYGTWQNAQGFWRKNAYILDDEGVKEMWVKKVSSGGRFPQDYTKTYDSGNWLKSAKTQDEPTLAIFVTCNQLQWKNEKFYVRGRQALFIADLLHLCHKYRVYMSEYSPFSIKISKLEHLDFTLCVKVCPLDGVHCMVSLIKDGVEYLTDNVTVDSFELQQSFINKLMPVPPDSVLPMAGSIIGTPDTVLSKIVSFIKSKLP